MTPQSTQGFSYDSSGERTAFSAGPSTWPYPYDPARHRLLSTAGPAALSFSYDAAGQATARGALHLAYDARGRLSADFAYLPRQARRDLRLQRPRRAAHENRGLPHHPLPLR